MINLRFVLSYRSFSNAFYVQVSLAPLQWPEVEEYTKLHETTISTTITWHHKGHQVAIEGSWDNWANRCNAYDLSYMKKLRILCFKNL